MSDGVLGFRCDGDAERYDLLFDTDQRHAAEPSPEADPFTPEWLVYSCEDTPVRTIREVLTIPPPGDPGLLAWNHTDKCRCSPPPRMINASRSGITQRCCQVSLCAASFAVVQGRHIAGRGSCVI